MWASNAASQSQNRQQWVAAVAGSFLVAALVVISRESGADFAQDYAAAWAWWHGMNPSAPTFLIYQACCPEDNVSGAYQTAHPPFATFLVLPFGLLPFKVARTIWLMLGCLAIPLAWLCVGVNREMALSTAAMWVVGLSLGVFEPILMLMLALALRVSPYRPDLTAVLIGLAAAIKIYPGVLLIAFFIALRWREGLYGLITAVGVTFVADLILGAEAFAAWLAYIPWNVERYIGAAGNASIVRLVHLAFPGVSISLASALVIVLLILPMAPYLFRSGDWRSLLPIMIAGSPLVGPHYVALLGLGRSHHGIALCFGIGGIAALLSRVGLLSLSHSTEIVIIAPLISGLLIMWLDAVRWGLTHDHSIHDNSSSRSLRT